MANIRELRRQPIGKVSKPAPKIPRIRVRSSVPFVNSLLIPGLAFVAVTLLGTMYLRGDFAGTPGSVSVQFSICGNSARATCVIDGDTIWHEGVRIRLSDIDTPEVGQPRCAEEAELGRRATLRLQDLLNAGPFQIVKVGDRDQDVYGRKLREIRRDGQSLGDVLVAEGLAEHWTGRRGTWC